MITFAHTLYVNPFINLFLCLFAWIGQLQEGPRLAFKDETNGDPNSSINIEYDKQVEYVFNWYDRWSPEVRWQCFSGLQAIDGKLMADFYNSMHAMQVWERVEDKTNKCRRKRLDRFMKYFYMDVVLRLKHKLKKKAILTDGYPLLIPLLWQISRAF